jgi:RHS repeat-associated protein
MNNYIYNEIGQLETNVQDQIGYEYNASGLVTKINEFSAINTGDWSMIYSQNFTTATFSENSYWVVDEGSALVNYNSYRTNIATVHCNELQATYGNSMGIIKPGNILTQSPGQLTVTRELTAMNGKLHQLSLDLIIKQIEHRRRLEPFDPNNPPPIVVLADNPMGYKVEVLDANQQVLATTTYNYPNPVLINDPNLSDFQPCSGYYTNGHSLQFTPNTDTIDLKVTAYYDANVPEAAFYIDNIELEVAEAPRLAFYYNDRGQRVRKESYDNNGNTQRTIYVRDAGGSPMAIYEEATGPTVQQPETLKELPVYGAGRLGVYYKDNDGGTYAYQISDHLGNVRAVMIKVGTNALSLTNKTDYYPFGMPMPDRNAEGDYRYKYQGQEKDTETGKEAFELRLWDSRIGRWSNPDPVKEFKSPYVGMANDPISFIDRRGDSVWVFSEQVKLDTWWPKNSLVHFFGRHLFLRVKTDVFDLTIELQGPRKTIKRGDIEERYTGRTGTPTFKSFSPKNFKNGRGTVHGPVLVSGDTENFNFEYKVLNEFFRFIRKEEDDDGVFDFSELPDYNGYGPNSNGFVQHLLQNAGHPGLWANFTEKVGHVGLNDTEQYKSPDHNKINEHD